ncbi:hypothetical protein ACWKWW_04025 [Chryseobacterium cucumeris]
MIKRIGKIILIIILGSLVFITGKFLLVWKSVEIDHSLSQKPIFKAFNQQKQATLWSQKGEDRKTNDFKLTSDNTSFEYYSCYINRNPTLNITFSVGDGFSGGGYQIDILQNRYKVSPYSYTDNIKPFDFLNTGEYYKVLDSKVVLDKESYQKGDSIFGYTELKIQEGYGLRKYIEEGKGYFKGKVN